MKRVLSFSIICLFFISCHNEDDTNSNSDTDVIIETPGSEDTPSVFQDLEQGDVGFRVDVRPFLKAGLYPASVEVDYPSNILNSLSSSYVVNNMLGIATIKYSAEMLSEEQLATFRSLFQVNVKVFDQNNTLLATKNINSATNNVDVRINISEALVNLPAQDAFFTVDENVNYALQHIDTNQFLTLIRPVPTADSSPALRSLPQYTGSFPEEFLITFKEHPTVPHGYTMYVNDQVWAFADYDAPVATTYTVFLYNTDIPGIVRIGIYIPFYDGADDVPNHYLEYVQGYSISGITGNIPWEINDADVLLRHNSDYDFGTLQEFRLIAPEIVWEANDFGTVYSDPIFNEGTLDYAYRQSISNCANVEVEQVVGREESETTTVTVGSEESFEVFTTHTANVQVTAGLTAGFNAFGASVEASLEVSAGYEYSTGQTNSSTNTFENTSEETTTTSYERTITIPPYTRIGVFDGVQTINDTKLKFAKTLQLSGTDFITGHQLSGAAIKSLMEANFFQGYVIQVDSDNLLLNLRGSYTIDKLVSTKTEIVDLGDCE